MPMKKTREITMKLKNRIPKLKILFRKKISLNRLPKKLMTQIQRNQKTNLNLLMLTLLLLNLKLLLLNPILLLLNPILLLLNPILLLLNPILLLLNPRLLNLNWVPLNPKKYQKKIPQPHHQ